MNHRPIVFIDIETTGGNRENGRFKMDRVCTVKLSRILYPNERRHGLDYVINRLGVNIVNRHRAYDEPKNLRESKVHP